MGDTSEQRATRVSCGRYLPFLLLLALLTVTLLMAIRSMPEMSEEADWIIQAKHIYDDAKPVIVELEERITQ